MGKLRDQATSAVKKFWRERGWKMVALITAPLALIFGCVAGVQRVLLQEHRLQIDSTGPNWADIVTALSTFLLAVGAVFGLLAVLEARRARHAETITEAARRWDDKALRHLRARVRGIVKDGGGEALKDRLLALRKANSREYFELLAIPDYFEDVAIMMTYRAVTFRMVDDSLGVTVANYWTDFEPFVIALRELIKDKHAYENFQTLGMKIRELHPQSDDDEADEPDDAPLVRQRSIGPIQLTWAELTIDPAQPTLLRGLADRIKSRRVRRRVIAVSYSWPPS